jgi:hypothetical protein
MTNEGLGLFGPNHFRFKLLDSVRLAPARALSTAFSSLSVVERLRFHAFESFWTRAAFAIRKLTHLNAATHVTQRR